MSARPHHMHDGSIVERRLRPIYDWLDNGNNKKALQEAEKVLKKSPSLQSARALKALALLRLGKAPEAHAILDVLAEEKPSDDTTLQAMTISYRESHQLPKVCALYEAAVKAEPTSEELYSHLFMSYVRVGDYKSQQRAAMALYKFAPKNPYYFWAVMSIILQAKTSDEETKKKILLALAQRMVDNFITENKMEAEQEARLYIMILELQEKWEDIVKFIESPLYSKLVPGPTSQTCIPYLKKLGQWRKVNFLCKELLWENQDRWDYYLPYLDSVFELMKGSTIDGDTTVDDTPEKCHEFICQLVEITTSGRVLRGPYLARLELWKRLSVVGDPSALFGSGVALCVQYLRVFAHKPCAVPDLRTYLAVLSQKEREEHCRDFLTCLGFDEKSEPDTMDDIQRHVSCLAAWRLTAPPLEAAENIALATWLRQLYLNAMKRGLHTSTLTEFCATDGYAVLAAHHYFYAAVQQESSAPLLEAVTLLELAIHRSPANFHIKLLLVIIYHLLGLPGAVGWWWRRLDVKHIQLVSLGWLSPVAPPPRALRLLADATAVYQHASDSIEQVTYAYKFGTFEKVCELRAWGSRLSACAWSRRAVARKQLLALLAGPPTAPAVPTLPPDSYTDNRDIDVIINYDPPQYQNPELKSKTFLEEIAYLQQTEKLVSAIALCSEFVENKTIEEKKEMYKDLLKKIEEFGEMMESSRQTFKERTRRSISYPFPSKLIAFVTSPVPYRELYSMTLRLVGAFTCDVAGAHALCEQLTQMVTDSTNILRKRCDAMVDKPRDRLEASFDYLEFIGVISYLLGLSSETVTPNTKKSKKKTNQSPDEVKTIELLNQLNVSVQNSITSLECMFENWPKHKYESNLEEEFTNLSIKDKYKCPVKERLKSSHEELVHVIINILKQKTKYLKSL